MSAIKGHAVVVQPDEGPSYWQPVPANGHADPELYPDRTRFPALSMGYQTHRRPAAACVSTRTATRSSCRSASAARAAWWSTGAEPPARARHRLLPRL